MGLGWLVPAFLAGLAALVVPILVHLRQREKREPIRFPSLMFLRKVPHRTSERRRITHPILLLLRALAVTALVAAFARPFWRREDARPAAGVAGRAIVVAIDRSMSMSYRGVWDRALDSVAAVLSTVGPRDRTALIAFDETAEVVAPLEAGAGAARARLAAIGPGGKGSRLAPAIRAARELAGQARGLVVEIVVVSDLQRHALTGLEAVERIPGATLRFASVAERNPANARVVDVDVDRRAEGRRSRLTVGAQIAAKGDAGRAVKASLVVNGRTLATTSVTLGPNAAARARFEPVWIAEGDAVGVVALDADALAADDTLRFSLASAAGVPVLLQLPAGGGAEESVYLEQALGISRAPALAITTRRGPAPTAADLAKVRVAVVADLGGLGPRGLAPFETFVAGGGGLVLIAGPRGTGPTAPWLPATVGKIIDRTAERGGRLGQLDGDHPVFEPFKEALSSDFGAARFFRYRELVSDSTGRVIARFDDGRPAIVESRLGAGRIFLVATTGSALWSDFPLQPVFLPLLQRLVVTAGMIQDPKRWYAVGEAVTLPDNGASLTISGPGGPDRRLPPDSAGRTLTLDFPGDYLVRSDLAAAPLDRFLVNPAAAESDLAAAEPQEALAQLKAPADSTAAPNVAPLTAVEQERRQSWWSWLLALALLLLGAETVYAARLERRTPMAGGTR